MPASVLGRACQHLKVQQGAAARLAIFALLFTLHAWNAYHKRVCGELVQTGGYPCGQSLFARLQWHFERPAHLFAITFFAPDDPADAHDGISFSVAIVGGFVAIFAGQGGRDCTWRFGWLCSCVLAPKGFLIAYGLLNPASGLGVAANTMLPRHAAITLWINFVFPLRWRRQAVLASIYCSVLLVVIHMTEVRGWPYGSSITPAAVRARLIISSILSVAVSAAVDWWHKRAAASRAARKAAAALEADEQSCSGQARESVAQRRRQVAPLPRMGASGETHDPRIADPVSAASTTRPESAAGGSTSRTGASGQIERPPLAQVPSADALSMLAAAITLADSGAHASEGTDAPPLPLSPREAPLNDAHDGSDYQGDGTCISGGGAAAAAIAASFVEALRGRPPPSPPSAPSAVPRSATTTITTADGVGGVALSARPRYRSGVRLTRLHVKLGGVSPEQLDSGFAGTLSEDLAARGFVMTGVAVRSGCIEVLLEVEWANGNGGGGGGGGSEGGGSVAMRREELVTRVVSALVGALGPPSRPATRTAALGAGSIGLAAASVGAVAGSGNGDRGDGGGGGGVSPAYAGVHGGGSCGRTCGAAAAAAARVALPVRVCVDGTSYLVSREGGGAADTADGLSCGWRVWADPAGGPVVDSSVSSTGAGMGKAQPMDPAAAAEAAAPLEAAAAPGDPAGFQRRKGASVGIIDGAAGVESSAAGSGPPSEACAGAAAGAALDGLPPAAGPVLALWPPCLLLPPPAPAGAGCVAPAPSAPCASALEFVLCINADEPDVAGTEGWRAAAPAGGAAAGGLGAKALGAEPEAPPVSEAARPVPEVLAWTHGCFLQVLSVEEVSAPEQVAQLWPGRQGPFLPPSCRAFKVALDGQQAVYGLLSVTLRLGTSPVLPVPLPDSADGDAFVTARSGGGGARGGGGGFAPLAPPACALLLPPSLAPVCRELLRPLSEEAWMAAASRDADGAVSVADFLRDLSEWLAADTLHLQASPQTAEPAATAAAERNGFSSSGDCTASGITSGAGGGGDSGARLGGIMGAPGAGHGLTPTATSPALSASPLLGALSGGGGGGGPECGRPVGVGAEAAAAAVVRRRGVCGWSWRSVVARLLTPWGFEQRGAGTAAAAVTVKGTAPPSLPLPPSAAVPLAPPPPRLLLTAGRLDLRDTACAAVRAARGRAADAAARQREVEGRRWGLLEHAVGSGWPATARLLLGLSLEWEDGEDPGGGGGGYSGDAEAEPGAMGAVEAGRAVAEKPSLLHLAVLSGAPAIVDAVVEAAAAAVAAERYGAAGSGRGAYGTWRTLARLPAAGGGQPDVAAAPMTPLQLAAALAAGGEDAGGRVAVTDSRELLVHILRRYSAAAELLGTC